MNILQRFNENRKRFVKGEDYHHVTQADIEKSEKRTFEIRSPRGLILITESGYLMLVKSFTDDLAWRVQRQLVKSYFRAKQAEPQLKQPPALPTFDQTQLTATLDVIHKLDHHDKDLTTVKTQVVEVKNKTEVLANTHITTVEAITLQFKEHHTAISELQEFAEKADKRISRNYHRTRDMLESTIKVMDSHNKAICSNSGAINSLEEKYKAVTAIHLQPLKQKRNNTFNKLHDILKAGKLAHIHVYIRKHDYKKLLQFAIECVDDLREMKHCEILAISRMFSTQGCYNGSCYEFYSKKSNMIGNLCRMFTEIYKQGKNYGIS